MTLMITRCGFFCGEVTFFPLELTLEACPLHKVLAAIRHGLDDTSWNDTTETCQACKQNFWNLL